MPINLNIIYSAYDAEEISVDVTAQTNIFEKWFHQLIASAAKDTIPEETLWVVVFRTI